MGKKTPGGPGLLHAPLGPHGRALVPAAHAASVVSWPLPESSFLSRKGVTLTFKQPVASDPSSGISESTAEVCCERRRGPTLPAHGWPRTSCASPPRGEGSVATRGRPRLQGPGVAGPGRARELPTGEPMPLGRDQTVRSAAQSFPCLLALSSQPPPHALPSLPGLSL